MNILSGKIHQLEAEGKLTIVRVMVNNSLFTSIIINEGNSPDYLKLGGPMQVMFKESEVIIAKGNEIQISLRNQLPGKIESIETSNLLCKLCVQTDAGKIKSLITRNAVESLGLSTGLEVIAMIKTNEVLLTP